mmetsp:Transcript_7919/g.29618  ORF Transcript_7919/g.29618 Transcript_7919/m.29618 type:complete len:226 (+) Transcript_7919:2659-3336(+)
MLPCRLGPSCERTDDLPAVYSSYCSGASSKQGAFSAICPAKKPACPSLDWLVEWPRVGMSKRLDMRSSRNLFRVGSCAWASCSMVRLCASQLSLRFSRSLVAAFSCSRMAFLAAKPMLSASAKRTAVRLALALMSGSSVVTKSSFSAAMDGASLILSSLCVFSAAQLGRRMTRTISVAQLTISRSSAKAKTRIPWKEVSSCRLKGRLEYGVASVDTRRPRTFRRA